MLRSPSHRVLWLVRHGETNWNLLGWVQGHADDARLTRRGRLQARRVAALLETKDVEAVYSSDLRRARSTAEIIAGRLGLDVAVDGRLRERSFGALEGSWASLLPPETTGIDHGRVTDADSRAVGGESLTEVYLRCADFLLWLQAQDHRRDVVVVAHGGSIRMLRAVVTGADLSDLTWGTVANASVHRLLLPAPLRPAALQPAALQPAAAGCRLAVYPSKPGGTPS